jgi:hypothetical protein
VLPEFESELPESVLLLELPKLLPPFPKLLPLELLLPKPPELLFPKGLVPVLEAPLIVCVPPLSKPAACN